MRVDEYKNKCLFYAKILKEIKENLVVKGWEVRHIDINYLPQFIDKFIYKNPVYFQEQEKESLVCPKCKYPFSNAVFCKCTEPNEVKHG